MNHSFLFEPGVWTATGTFWCADGEGMDAEGRTEITHVKDYWMIVGKLRVLCSPPVEFVNVYSIEPPQKDGLTSRLTSENPTCGKLHGIFTVVGSSLVAVYRSEQGYCGSEHLSRIHKDHYEASGVLLMNDRRLSSWQLTLRR